MAETKTTKSATKKAPAKTAPKAKPEAKLNPCGCGCGTMVKNRFAQGHDARLKGQLLKVIYSMDKKTTDAQVKKATARMEAENWTHKINAKKASSAESVRKGTVAGMKPGEKLGKSAIPSADAVKAPAKAKAKAPAKKAAPKAEAPAKGLQTFDADDDIETVD